jgi:hypothetical protein
MALILAAVFGMQWYLLSGWFAWSGSNAFGPRFWVSMTPLFTLGLAALLKNLKRVPQAVLASIASLFIV